MHKRYNLLSKKGKNDYIMKPEDKKDIEAIERELHTEHPVRTATDPRHHYADKQ